MKKNIITINGDLGSGKSSTAKGVAKKLGYEHFSSGDLFREMAENRGWTIEEINFAAEKQREIDLELDEIVKRIGKEKDCLVMDSRMGFHFIAESFKVFLNLDPRIAARRTFEHIQKEGRVSQYGSSVEEVLQNTLERRASEKKRYQTLYGVDIADKSRYDLVVDTGIHGLNEVVNIVAKEYEKWQKNW